MKNKKLFAILTLVCFMFTLMPVAAFAAPGQYGSIADEYTAVEVGDVAEVTLNATGSFYVYAVKDGALAKLTAPTGDTIATTTGEAIGLQLVAATTTAGDLTINVVFAEAGEYTIGVANADNANLNAVIAGSEGLVPAATVLSNLETFKIGMLNNAVSVSPKDQTYWISISDDDGATGEVSATNGFDKEYFTATLTTTGGSVVAIPNAELEIVTDSYALEVVKVDAKTRVDGTLRFYVTGTIPGDYNIYVRHAAAAEKSYAVKVTPATIDDVTTVAQPTALQDKASADTQNVGVVFQFSDATGYAYTSGVTTTNYKVSVLEAPKGFSKTQTLYLKYEPQSTTQAVAGWEIVDTSYAPVDLDKEGKYTFQVALPNGSKAVASVNVDKFDKAVGLTFVNAPQTVAYGKGTQVSTNSVYEMDAKGVLRAASVASLTANGKAIATFVTTNGSLTIKDDEKYIGSKVTVLAVKGDLTATTELTVVDQAAGIVYTTTEVSVGANNTLKANVFDENGKFVAQPGTAQVIVIDKPENAVATVGTPAYTNGRLTVSFLASAAGEYTLQTIIKNGSEYISDIDTIVVGGAEGTFKDVIVMSIGANSLVKNSEVVAMPAAPEIVDSRTMVPARAGLEAFGATVVWDEATQTVTAELNGVKVVMEIGEKAYTVNGKAVVGDAAPYITASSTMVPVSFFTNAFGITATPIYDDHGVCDVLFTK